MPTTKPFQRGVDQMADAARRAGMMALAPADDSVLRRHLHHHAVALGHGADAERHLPLLRDAEAGGIGFDVDDLHFTRSHHAFGFSKGFCRVFPQFPQANRQSGLGVHPLGETAKLRTASRAEFPQGVSAGFRRFAPSPERAPFPKDSRFPPFPPVVLQSRPGGGLQQIAIEDAARAEFAGAADMPGFAEGRVRDQAWQTLLTRTGDLSIALFYL